MPMPRCAVFPLTVLLLAFAAAATARADAPPTTQRTRDVIYGRSYGTALTMDVIAPPADVDAKHRGVILIVSGGWFSAHESIDSPVFRWFSDGLVSRGYTVFCVVHPSQPKYT